MSLPKYDGTVHPDEWMSQIKAQCYLRTHGNIIAVAKLLVDPSINVDNVRTPDELVTVLKNNNLFKMFLKSNKQKLQDLRYEFKTYGEDNESIIEFLVKFKTLCRNAEVDDINEQKNYLVHALDVQYHYDFSEKIKNINTFDELLKSFQDFIIDQKSYIRSNYIVIIKHVTTGMYLSTKNSYYNTGGGLVVTLSKNQSDQSCQWKIINYNYNYNNNIFYGNNIGLVNPSTNHSLLSSNNIESPVTNHQKVYGQHNSYSYSNTTDSQWRVQFGNSVNYNGIWKLNDKFSLLNDNKLLRSHDFHFNIGNENFQEVICHDGRFSGNDEWCIEYFFIENENEMKI